MAQYSFDYQKWKSEQLKALLKNYENGISAVKEKESLLMVEVEHIKAELRNRGELDV